jgi:hypothetical protein
MLVQLISQSGAAAFFTAHFRRVIEISEITEGHPQSV